MIYHRFIKPSGCPNCHTVIQRRLLRQLNDYIANNHGNCPQCQTKLDRKLPIKAIYRSLWCAFITTIAAHYLAKYELADGYFIAILMLIGDLLIALPIMLIGIINAPYVLADHHY